MTQSWPISWWAEKSLRNFPHARNTAALARPGQSVQMANKRIILRSDGTGNSAGKVWRTNVWRVF
jgi:hypothetical protein